MSILHRSGHGTAGAISYTSKEASEAGVGRGLDTISADYYEHLTSDIVLGMTVKGLSYSGSA